MDCVLNILEEKQPTPDEIIEEEKLRYIASQITIRDFFGIPQSTYLAFSKDEKLRMFNECYIITCYMLYYFKTSFKIFCW